MSYSVVEGIGSARTRLSKEVGDVGEGGGGGGEGGRGGRGGKDLVSFYLTSNQRHVQRV